ncbi:MAG: hypothetical protein ACYTFT_14720, partial [Planctomycetota bacterium]
MKKPFLMAFALVLLFCGHALADDYLDKAKQAVDTLEKKVEALEPGDVPAAKKLMKELSNNVIHNLKQSPARGKPEWNEVLERGKALEATIKEKASQPRAPDAAMISATKSIDEVEAATASLAPGDVPAANELVGKLNAAAKVLMSSKNKGGPKWSEVARRHQALDKRIREIAAKPAAAKPQAPAAPAAPKAPEATPAPPTPAAPEAAADPDLSGEIRITKATSIPDLEFNDKRMLGFFDKDFGRATSWLAKAKVEELQDPKNTQWWASTKGKLQSNVSRMTPTGQKHLETRKRLELLRRFEADLAKKQAASFANLSKDDTYYLDKTKKLCAEVNQRLAGHKGTVLQTDGSTIFDRNVQGVYQFHAKIKNQGHPDVKVAKKSAQELELAVEASKQESAAKAKALGDVQAKVAGYVATFQTKSGFPPALPGDEDPAKVKAFAEAVKGWQPKLSEALAYIAEAKMWSPVWRADVDLSNKGNRFANDAPYQLSQAIKKARGSWFHSIESAQGIDPESIEYRDLRGGAFQQKRTIQGGLVPLECARAYFAVLPDPSVGDLDAIGPTLEKNLARIEARCAEQLASERFPETETEPDAGLLAEAQRLVGGDHVKRLELWRGKRSKQYESTEREGDRIFIYKWDYDFFSAHSARQHEDGTWWVHM